MSSVIKKFCSAFFLLAASKSALSNTVLQGPDNVTKVPKAIMVPASFEMKDAAFNFLTDTSSNEPKEVSFPITRDTSYNQIDTKLKAAALRMKENTANLKAYIAANDFNAEYCFLVDMSIPSGKKRFFVYNLKTGTVELSSLVSHGSGSYKPNCNDQLVFSNIPNSYTTSLGRYKIGNSYYGTYGLSYRLYGLDSTNNKAFERAIVLHSDNCVPVTETYPRHIYESAGCPIVPPSFLAIVDKYIKTSKKPILLWIYN